jgi:hypothetical protein
MAGDPARREGIDHQPDRLVGAAIDLDPEPGHPH